MNGATVAISGINMHSASKTKVFGRVDVTLIGSLPASSVVDVSFAFKREFHSSG